MKQLINKILLTTIYSVLAFDIELLDTLLYANELTRDIDSFDDAKEKCDSERHCAGISYDQDANNKSHVISYSFLPNSINDGSIYHSQKSFTLHRGRVMRGTIISQGHERMTVDQGKLYCQSHPSCVAFFYPVHSLDLVSPDNITFVSSINIFDKTPQTLEHDWYTFISNDLSKAKYVNESSLELDTDLIDNPFPKCCRHTQVPSLEGIEAVDTFERIPCNISREEFKEKYEIKRKPVMLVGCDKEWKALDRWNFEDLIPRFENDTVWRTHIDDGQLEEQVEWSRIVDAMTNKGFFYIFDPIDRGHQKVLYEDYSTPFPLKGADLYETPKRDGFPSKSYGKKLVFLF